jgi:hypothetical protein
MARAEVQGPPQQVSAQAAARLDPAIAALIQRVKNGARPSVDEARFVFGGEAYVRLTVTDFSPGAFYQLRKAGFTITRQEGNRISGHVPAAALEPIAKLPFITWIAPR